jgi:hypothetical protein
VPFEFCAAAAGATVCNDAAPATMTVDAVVDHSCMATERAGGLRAVGMSATAISHAAMGFCTMEFFLSIAQFKRFDVDQRDLYGHHMLSKTVCHRQILNPFETNTRGEPGLSLFLFLAGSWVALSSAGSVLRARVIGCSLGPCGAGTRAPWSVGGIWLTNRIFLTRLPPFLARPCQ